MAIDTWDPRQYDKFQREREQPFYDLLAMVRPADGMRAVDLGCGTGKLTRVLHQRVNARETTGIDRSDGMLAKTREGPLPAGLRFRVGTIEEFAGLGSAAAEPAPPGGARAGFDLIFSNAALHWVDDHRAFLRGAAEHLHPNGRLILSCGGAGNAAGIIAALERLISSPVWSVYFTGFEFPYHFYSPDHYADWLPAANLVAVRCELVEKDMVHDGPEGLAGWIRTTWMPYTQRVPEDLREKFISDLISEYLRDHPADSSGHTHVQMMRLEVEATKAK